MTFWPLMTSHMTSSTLAIHQMIDHLKLFAMIPNSICFMEGICMKSTIEFPLPLIFGPNDTRRELHKFEICSTLLVQWITTPGLKITRGIPSINKKCQTFSTLGVKRNVNFGYLAPGLSAHNWKKGRGLFDLNQLFGNWVVKPHLTN